MICCSSAQMPSIFQIKQIDKRYNGQDLQKMKQQICLTQINSLNYFWTLAQKKICHISYVSCLILLEKNLDDEEINLIYLTQMHEQNFPINKKIEKVNGKVNLKNINQMQKNDNHLIIKMKNELNQQIEKWCFKFSKSQVVSLWQNMLYETSKTKKSSKSIKNNEKIKQIHQSYQKIINKLRQDHQRQIQSTKYSFASEIKYLKSKIIQNEQAYQHEKNTIINQFTESINQLKLSLTIFEDLHTQSYEINYLNIRDDLSCNNESVASEKTSASIKNEIQRQVDRLLKIKLKQYQHQRRLHEHSLNLYEHKLKTLLAETQKKSNIIHSLTIENHRQKQQYFEFNIKFQILQTKYSKIEQEFQQLRNKMKDFEANSFEIIRLKKQLQIQKQKLMVETIMKNEWQKSSDRLLKQKLQLQKYIERYEVETYFHIFDGPILQQKLKTKQYLRSTIEQYTKHKILKTKLLYNFTLHKKQSFKDYIIGYDNIVLIIKTSNNSCIAGFSKGAISPNKLSVDGGLLVSLTHQKSYTIKNFKRSVSYDDEYIIFGNSELRIRQMSDKLFSNFGMTNSFYDNEDDRVDMLLNQGQTRHVVMKSYQVYEVVFRK